MTNQTTPPAQPQAVLSSAELGKLYADRDHAAQGDYYMRHLDAMTREGLHAKSDIAGELAHRDIEIQQLRQLLAVRVAGALLYADDGELQDNTQHPCIDFRRDTPSDIQRKLQERGLSNYRRSLEDHERGILA